MISLTACATSKTTPTPSNNDDINIKQARLEGTSSCVLTHADDVYCWGNKALTNQAANTNTPVKIKNLPPIDAIALAHNHACALTKTSKVYCWGASKQGQAGKETAVVQHPIHIKALPPIHTLALGSDHSCALSKKGTVYCWGSNRIGTLGRNLDEDQLPMDATPTKVNHLSKITKLTSHSEVTIAQDINGKMFVWGRIDFIPSKMNDGVPENLCNGNDLCSIKPYHWFKNQTVSTYAIGYSHGCIVTPTHDVYCMGSNQYGKLGINTKKQPKLEDLPVKTMKDVKSIHQGNIRTCAITQKNAVYCWGSDIAAQPKFPFTNHDIGHIAPTEIKQLQGAQQLVVGISHVCGLKSGQITCWLTKAINDANTQQYKRVDTYMTLAKMPKIKTLIEHPDRVCGVSMQDQLWCASRDSVSQSFETPRRINIKPDAK